MPRVTPLRLFLLLPLGWLFLALLWAVLPSPSFPWNDDPSQYVWRGGTLTRVYQFREFFPWNDPLQSIQDARNGRDSFALDYRYDHKTGELNIGYSLRLEHRVCLTAPSLQTPSLSAPFAVHAKTGDHDGINLPWFTKADAPLLFWEIHRDSSILPLRFRAVNATTFEVWPDSSIWEDYGKEEVDQEKLFSPWNLAPLLTISLPSPTSAFRVVVPATKQNSSPSCTFIVRRAISSVLVPVGLFVNDYIVNLLYYPVTLLLYAFVAFFYWMTAYSLVVLACWSARRFPPFWPWTRTFWLTRWLATYVAPKESSVGLDEHQDGGEKMSAADNGPTPLTSVWGFFTSRSPLDDLLATFEVTKPFIQPLRWSTPRTPTTDEENDPSPARSAATEQKKAGLSEATGTDSKCAG